MEAITKYIENTMQNGGTTDNRQIRKICEQNGINLDEKITKVKEAVEIGLMHVARNIAQSDKPLRKKYDELIDLYNRQPYVGTKKTLKQMVLQQYSTPLPIAFLMSEFVKNKSNSSLYFEPSAGNGFLTISLPQENTICNEIDRYRLENLKNEHYRKVSEQDARQPFEYSRIFDGVVTNPPFLKGQETNTMIFNALETMKDSGRCAILRDGNAQFTEYAGTKLRSSFTGFYDKLFQEYNVVKIININAKKIYAKQGTSFFMHIILINGRRANKLSDDDSMHRVYNPEIDKIELAGFEELWEYFLPYFIDETTYYYYSLANKSKLLFKELELTIEVGDEFVKEKQLSWKQKSKIDYWLRTNKVKDKKIFDFYYVSHINKNGDIYLFNKQNDITQIYTRKEFYELGLQFYKHYKPKGFGSIDVTYIIEYGDDIKAFVGGKFVLSCDRFGYVNPYFTIKYSNEAERLHRFRNYCEHVFKHTFEVKGGDSYVSPILIKELGLLITKNDVFIEPLKGAKEKNSLTQKEADQLKYYIVTDIYGVGDDTKIALNITSRVDGCNKVVFPIDYFLSKKLKYAYHAHELDGLGSLDPDFVIEYHCNGEIYYDLETVRKRGNKIKAAICGIDITTNISDTDTEQDVAEKLVKCEYEYVLHGLVNKYDKNLKESEYYKVIFTNYTYICHVISLDKPYKIDIINRYDTISDNGVSGTNAFDNEGYRPNGEPHIHKLFP